MTTPRIDQIEKTWIASLGEPPSDPIPNFYVCCLAADADSWTDRHIEVGDAAIKRLLDENPGMEIAEIKRFAISKDYPLFPDDMRAEHALAQYVLLKPA